MKFEWSLPTRIVFGAGRFGSTHKFVRGLGKKAFIVTSPSFGTGGARAAVLGELLAQLRKIGVETLVFSEIEPNPRTTTIDRAAARLREFNPRYVLGLGGGSVMDSAKCLALLGANAGGIYEYSYRGPGRPMTPFNHALPIVCIPTVAATSSETDFYAVVTNEAEKRKTTVFGEPLQPTLSIIDPELTYTVPARQTIDGAFDIITHVMETYLSTEEPAPFQDRLTEAVVETVVTSLPRVLENPRDELGRSQLSWCAAFALSGALSGRQGGWPIHTLEAGVNAFIDNAHGRGLAMILPQMMRFDSDRIGDKINDFNRRIFGKPSLDDGLVPYMKRVGAWTSLDELLPKGADARAIIEKSVDAALEVKAVWKRGEEPYIENIRPISRQDAIDILTSCR